LTAGTVAYAAAVFAVNFALSSIVTRMFADNPEGQQDMGVRQQVPPSGVNAIPIVYGDAYMGGTFVDAVLANEQRKMYYVLVAFKKLRCRRSNNLIVGIKKPAPNFYS